MQRRKQAAPKLRKKKRQTICGQQMIAVAMVIGGIFLLFFGGLYYEFSKMGHVTTQAKSHVTTHGSSDATSDLPPYLKPMAPVLPIFASMPNAESLAAETLKGSPTMAGVITVLQNFVYDLHFTNMNLAAKESEPKDVLQAYFDVAVSHLRPLDEAYRGRSVFPIREDESIFMSLAAYREHLLADTLKYAFSQSMHPDKLYVGAVVQNCFGNVLDDYTVDASGLPCKTGFEVIGKNKKGKDMTKVSDAPPDKNGIADFCAMPDFKKYCDNGQVRVLYVHETESLGPAYARYLASKLWGGETYFVQTDSHLQFAIHWDEKYRNEIKATSNFPKSVLSSYPPGFNPDNGFTVKESNGARLCHCETNALDPNPIIRINVGKRYQGDEPRPTQIPFIAAGFFFARAEFLVDVPFDPYIPWCFMGEEIALSMRAWTQGWNIYAPRKNLIAHQYRPGRLGLPKFWESTNRLHKKGGMNNRVQSRIIKRIKHFVGYPDATKEEIASEGFEFILTDMEHYGLGKIRTWDDYMKFANLSVDTKNKAIACAVNSWCNQGQKD